jgi:hypothetical protein
MKNNRDNSTTIGSIYSETLTLYHDTDNPDSNDLNDLRSKIYNGTVIDFNVQGKTPITRDTTIDLTSTSERLSDRLFTLTHPKGNKQDLSSTKITQSSPGVTSQASSSPHPLFEWNQANSLKVKSGALNLSCHSKQSEISPSSDCENQVKDYLLTRSNYPKCL